METSDSCSSNGQSATVAVISKPIREDEDGKVSSHHPQSERYHRFMSVERLGAYSDAVFSIIVTFMIIPLSTAVDDFEPGSDVMELLVENWHRFLIYAICYFFVFACWEHHVRVFEVVEHLGDTVIVLNVIQLLAVSMLPFMAALLGDYHADPLATLLLSLNILTICLLQICLVAFAYRRKKMMAEHCRKRHSVVELYSSTGILAALSGLTAAVAYGNLIASWVILGFAIFADTFSILLVSIYQRFRPHDKYKTFRGYFKHRIATRRTNPDRTKNLTDGVFAIVATLIILDLTNAAANPSSNAPGSIREELQEEKGTFFSYFATFTTVGMMWYIHYTVFHPMHMLNRITSLCNKWVLLFVGVLPMGFKLISKYATDTRDNNENTSVQFNCAIIFGASLFQLLTWLSGHWNRHKHLHSGYGRVHTYWSVSLLLVYPIISLLLFLIAFSESTLDANIVQSIQIAVPFIFFIMKICFELFLHKTERGRTYYQKDSDNVDKDTSPPECNDTNSSPNTNDTNL